MMIRKTKLEGVLIIEPDIFKDNRGWFMESYHKEKLKDLGLDIEYVQDNHSSTLLKGTIRGLHFQNKPYAQTKLVSCIRGAVLDVAVDIRKDSPTYKQWIAVELSEENKKRLFIPRDFAHGFLTLSNNAEVYYKVDNHYSKEHDRSIRFDDPEIGITWDEENPTLSEKDRNAPFLKDCDIDF